MNYNNSNYGYRTRMPQALYSKRHMQYGSGLYMLDVDGVEYNEVKQPVLITEWKHGRIREIDLGSFQFEMLRNTFPKLPIICLVYYFFDSNKDLINEWDNETSIEHVQYTAVAANAKAENFLGKEQVNCSELEWVSLLYGIRNEEIPATMVKQLKQSFNECRVPAIINKVKLC